MEKVVAPGRFLVLVCDKSTGALSIWSTHATAEEASIVCRERQVRDMTAVVVQSITTTWDNFHE
jgi:hypothetical protein